MSTITTNAPEERAATGRPIQIVPASEKTPKWYRQNGDYYISKASFNFGAQPNQRKDIGLLYQVYNNQFPTSWFTHITDPLSAKKKQHKAWPAKIRPVTILRTNLDLLLGEYPKRPFVYNVENLGDTGYNRFMEGMQQQAQQNLTEHFIRAAAEQMQASGQEITEEWMQKMQSDPPVPEQVKEQFKASYKDAIAIKGQKWLRRTLREQEIKKKMHRMFKDWLIAGESYSYKTIRNDKIHYQRISPMKLSFDKSESQEYVEDGEWVVHRDMLTLSDVVDQFYDELKFSQLEKLENNYYATPEAFYQHLTSTLGLSLDAGKVPVYHVQWKGRKKIGFLSYMDMETFQLVEEEVDEDYVVNREKGEQVEWRWVNVVEEVWRITDDIYLGGQECPIQRNQLNNHSACKLSYNGRRYSDTHAENISVLEMGIPFQIMYIIVTFILEKTIAKSKGKIFLMDKKTIPDDGDWDEEKFFYYAEGLGYALIDRSKPGVDKSWNQYQVIDLSLFENIKQLIELQAYFKQQWDDVIGITRQRKGQTMAADGQGVNERSVFQSTVITDMIFIGFEEYCERELQGLLDLSKFATAKGVYGTYNDDDFGVQLMEIQPEDLSDEDLGVFIESSAETLRKLEEARGLAQAMLQNNHKASTVMELIDAVNMADLRTKLKRIEEIDQQVAEATAENEHQRALELENSKKMFLEYQELLKRGTMHEEYQEKQDIEMIKGTFNTFTFQNGDSNANGVPDATEVQKILQGQMKIQVDLQDRTEKRGQKQKEIDLKMKELEHKIDYDNKKLKLEGRKITAAKNKPAAKKK